MPKTIDLLDPSTHWLAYLDDPDAEIEWCVQLSDGSEVYVWADDKGDAMQEAIERGYYQPTNATPVQP